MTTTAPSARRRDRLVGAASEPGAGPDAGAEVDLGVGLGVELDEAQRRAVAGTDRVRRVFGAPGTGKTTVVRALVVDRVRRGLVRPGEVLVLGASRVLAGELRERLAHDLGGTTSEPLARTAQSFGFALLRDAAIARGLPAPRLITGPEQDVVLRDLLAGHARGEGRAPRWPDELGAATGTRGFRAELRELLMRAVELGLEPADLAALGRAHARPEWVAAADVLDEYDEVTALSRPGAFDPAWVLGAATDLLLDDPEARARTQARVRLLVVDDAHELTPAAARLLQTVVDAGTEVVLLGDPDVAVQGFRGGDPRLFADGWGPFRGSPVVVLDAGHRLGGELAGVAARVAGRIGALGGGGHRRPEPVSRPVPGASPSVECAVVDGPAQETHLVTARLRRAHLLDGVPWSQMAVVVRGRRATGAIRRALTTAGVPVAVPGADVPVREEPAARALLSILRVVLAGELTGEQEAALDVEGVLDLLGSPFGASDAMAVRRLRRALRRLDRADGSRRSSDELLLAAVTGEERLLGAEPGSGGLHRLARMLAAGRHALARGTGTSAEDVLWAVWEASGVASAWRRTALAGGSGSARADRDLDAVCALFDVAARFVERLPGRGPRGFLDHVLGQELAADSLAASAPAGQAVTVTTPQGAAGREWDVVAVCGVQEGAWPDLRLRGSVLGSAHLVDVVAGRETGARGARRAVRDDETRLFLTAVSRARSRLLVTAVRSEDDQPSSLLDLVDPPAPGAAEARERTPLPRPMSMAGLVAELRRRVCAPGTPAPERAAAAATLARLAEEGVPGAAADRWWSVRPVSDDRPLREGDAPLVVSPSRIETYQSCGLRWLLTASGGENGHGAGASAVGNLVHEIAAQGDADAATLHARLDERWPELGLGEGWLSRRSAELAHRMIDRLVRYDEVARGQGREVVGRELAAEAVIGRAVVRGRVDRLERDPDGRLRVVDLKTGAHKPTGAELDRLPQLGAYQALVEAGVFGEGSSGGAALLQLGKASTSSVTLQAQRPLGDDDDPQWAGRLVEESAEGMSASTFAVRVNDACRVCPVRESCPEQAEGWTW